MDVNPLILEGKIGFIISESNHSEQKGRHS